MRRQRDASEWRPGSWEPAEPVEEPEPEPETDWMLQTPAERAAARRRLDRLADRSW